MIDSLYKTDLLNEMFEGIYIVDKQRKITFWNKGAEKITGFLAEEVVGSHCHNNILRHVNQEGNKLCFYGCPLMQTITDGKIQESEVFLHHKEGHRVPVTIKTLPIFENGEIAGAMEIMIDTSMGAYLKDEVEKYRNLAMKDRLTSLPSRLYTETYLDLKMKEYKKLELPFGVAFMDIDHFKTINDTYGHEVGDEVLKMVSRTYVNSIRGNDIIGRWGGEEFIAIFTNCQEAVLGSLAEKIRMLIENSVLHVNDMELRVTISVGATMVRPEDSIDSLIKRADELMYQSKQSGRNKCTIA